MHLRLKVRETSRKKIAHSYVPGTRPSQFLKLSMGRILAVVRIWLKSPVRSRQPVGRCPASGIFFKTLSKLPHDTISGKAAETRRRAQRRAGQFNETFNVQLHTGKAAPAKGHHIRNGELNSDCLNPFPGVQVSRRTAHRLPVRRLPG